MSAPLVLILAAGMGTRMKSNRAKVLHEVAGKPMLAWAIDNALAAGAERVVAILGHQLEAVRDMLDTRYGAGVVGVAHQAEQRGTGHAVMCGLSELKDDSDDRVVVILSGDAPLLLPERISELAKACEGSQAKLALLSTRPDREVAYGHLLRDQEGKLQRIVEHADANAEEKKIDEVNAGFYAVSLGVLRRDTKALSSDNAQGELYLTDLATEAYSRGGAAVIECPFQETSGVNDRVDLAAVDKAARERINAKWMRAGVTMIDPGSIYIDADVALIRPDTVIEPGVRIMGQSKVGGGVTLGAGCSLLDAMVEDNASVGAYSVVKESRIRAGAVLAPFVYAHSGTDVGEVARVGSFAELRDAKILSDAKVGQLVYVGAASVGANATLGAGAVTCDFDGARHAKTTIEANAFVGSGAQLVAPATVGRDAYVGAGTVVTRNVPRGSLALSRVKQVNVDGWGARFRDALDRRAGSEPPEETTED